jgi:hypothetical protein
MRKFINSIGCKAEFDEGLSEEKIQKQLEMLSMIGGKGWVEVKQNDN